jgi:hypothetical protein
MRLRPTAGLFSIPKVIYEYGEPQLNVNDEEKPNK